jgi:hypothetical protein
VHLPGGLTFSSAMLPEICPNLLQAERRFLLTMFFGQLCLKGFYKAKCLFK